MNLIIAMMGYTFALVWEASTKQWWLQRAELCLTYEAGSLKRFVTRAHWQKLNAPTVDGNPL